MVLRERWDKVCKSKNTTKRDYDVVLNSEFVEFIGLADFSIFDHIPSIKIIELHSNTVYHAQRFGISVKNRPRVPLPPDKLCENEVVYTSELLLSFAEADSAEGYSVSSLVEESDYMEEDYSARKNFYAVEYLERFSCDWLPENCYEKLIGKCFEAISSTARQKFDNGYNWYLATNSQTASVNHSFHPLNPDINTQEKVA